MADDRRWFLAPCGLDCFECSIRLRTNEELEYWKQQGIDPSVVKCGGCRSGRGKDHWSPDCRILQCCVYEKEYEFCTECKAFPCETIEDWGKDYGHHAAAVIRLKEMGRIGVEQYLADWISNL